MPTCWSKASLVDYIRFVGTSGIRYQSHDEAKHKEAFE